MEILARHAGRDVGRGERGAAKAGHPPESIVILGGPGNGTSLAFRGRGTVGDAFGSGLKELGDPLAMARA